MGQCTSKSLHVTRHCAPPCPYLWWDNVPPSPSMWLDIVPLHVPHCDGTMYPQVPPCDEIVPPPCPSFWWDYISLLVMAHCPSMWLNNVPLPCPSLWRDAVPLHIPSCYGTMYPLQVPTCDGTLSFLLVGYCDPSKSLLVTGHCTLLQVPPCYTKHENGSDSVHTGDQSIHQFSSVRDNVFIGLVNFDLVQLHVRKLGH